MSMGLGIPMLLFCGWLLAKFFYERPMLGGIGPKQLLYPAVLGIYILLWATSAASSRYASLIGLHQQFLGNVALFLTLVWLVSLVKKDTSIMDIAYPFTAAIPVVFMTLSHPTWSVQQLLLVGGVGLWACRLSLHIGIRNLPHREDARYAAWRRRFGKQWWWWSFFQVFVLQGILVSLWSVPLVLAMDAGSQKIGIHHVLAIALFSVGFYFQAVADYQLERFRKTRRGPEEILDHGLWALSRHPNYFGESLIWWSFGCLGLSHELGPIGLLAPLYVSWFMARGSATPMQEKYLAKKKPGYAAYVARVPAFFPKLKP